ncbi:MAG: hypothetical protein GY745_02500 [Actinomycetia bacterium]|nr:hypothetical protein [Actinomycetes bacterium]MCP3910542.1 hypothetical protein [Actinomycetes bacterium]MCP4083918.1 hypothetical protein [Actinomycetes bacterium]
MALALLNPTSLSGRRIDPHEELSAHTSSSTPVRIDRICDLVAELTSTDQSHAIDAVFEAHSDLGDRVSGPDPLDLVARALVKLRRGTAADQARRLEPPCHVPPCSLRRWEGSQPN